MQENEKKVMACLDARMETRVGKGGKPYSVLVVETDDYEFCFFPAFRKRKGSK